MGPHSDGFYFLHEGGKLCSEDGYSMVGNNHADYQLSYLYDTASFRASTWSTTGCRNGLCGSESDCSAHKGETTFSENGNHYWKKYCQQMEPDSRYNFCFWKVACQIWTTEVTIHSWFKVYEIGTYIEVHTAVENCAIEWSSAHSLSQLSGMSLLEEESGLHYICGPASSLGTLTQRALGDLQSNDRKTFDLNWDWGCSFPSVMSTNICKPPVSFAGSHLDRCERLPSVIGSLKVDMVNGILRAIPVDGWKAKVTCSFQVLPDSNKTCHDAEAKIVGREGMNDDSIAIRVQGHSDGLVTLNITCFEELIEVECDGEWHTFPLLESQDCYFRGQKLRDTRILARISDDVFVDVPPSHLHYTGLMVIVLIVILTIVAVKVLCECYHK